MQRINDAVDYIKDELIKATQEIIQIKSVAETAKPGMPFGEGVNNALTYALRLSSSMGFRTVNVDGYMGYAEYGQGEGMVGVLGHLDIVPEGGGWDYPPYGGEIHDGKLYGRGAVDDKGPIIAALFGLKGIKDAGMALSKRVRIFFGTNEEQGSTEVPYYLERDEAPVAGFTPDAMYPLIYAEKGILIFNADKVLSSKMRGPVKIKYIKGGNAANMVPDYCEAALELLDEEAKKNKLNKIDGLVAETGYDVTYQDKGSIVILKSKGVSAHGSLPELGRNAIMQLLTILSGLNLDGDVKGYIDFFAENVGMDVKGEKMGLYLKDDAGDLSFNVGVIDIDEGRASVALNIRYPVTFKTSDVMDKFNEKIKTVGIEVKNMMEQPPLYFPKDHQLILTLQRVFKEQTGLDSEILAIGGGTYAKEMPNTVAFGPIFPGKPDPAHQANEYIEVDDLIMNAKIFGNAIYELAK